MCIRDRARRGLEDGVERLRGQLRDTAQGGQADRYGGDQIEDAAASGVRQAEHRVERLLGKGKKTVSYTHLDVYKRQFKDAVCPDSLEFKKDHFVMGNKYGRVLFLKEYASYIKDSMINLSLIHI